MLYVDDAVVVAIARAAEKYDGGDRCPVCGVWPHRIHIGGQD